MSGTDDRTAEAVAEALGGLPDAVGGDRVVFGFDGYVDRVREAVADRRDWTDWDRLATLAAFDERVGRSVAAGSSLSFEWRRRDTRAGGHTSHLARAYANWEFDAVAVGTYGDPVRAVFADALADCELHSVGDPGETDALEFDDGKLMFTEVSDTVSLDWDGLVAAVGRDALADRLDGAALLGVGYWAETPRLPALLDGLRDLLADLDGPPETVLVDPGDVRKLDRGALRAGRDAFSRLDDATDVVLSANRAETRLLAETYGDADPPDGPDAVADAATVFDALSVSLVVCHGIDRSVAVTDDGPVAVAVPRAEDPAMTTSSGDHFNAGLSLALVEGVSAAAAVAVGNATAGSFVRTGEPPSYDDVTAFLRSYGDRFG